jgi:hypothetical protein
VAPRVQNREYAPLIRVKHLENVGVLDLYRLNIIPGASIYFVTQLLIINNKNILLTNF